VLGGFQCGAGIGARVVVRAGECAGGSVQLADCGPAIREAAGFAAGAGEVRVAAEAYPGSVDLASRLSVRPVWGAETRRRRPSDARQPAERGPLQRRTRREGSRRGQHSRPGRTYSLRFIFRLQTGSAFFLGSITKHVCSLVRLRATVPGDGGWLYA
jgi:hypothetical protein